MDFLKKNLKQILTLAVLILVLIVLRKFGAGEEEFAPDVFSESTSIVNQESEEKTGDLLQSSGDTDDETVDGETAEESTTEILTNTEEDTIKYQFRNENLWREHFEKHGEEFPYSTKEEYLEGANIMLENPNKLHKLEKEDGDDVYYLEETNEFIIVSKDGYLRTYFKPSKGKKYFDKQ